MPQRTMKICLLGSRGVGKTSLVRRFAYNTYSPDYIPSPGLTVSSKTVVVARSGRPDPYTLVLWDPATSLRSALPYAAFLDAAQAVVLVADLTVPDSVAALHESVAQVRRWNPQARFGVAANKADMINPATPAHPEVITELERLAASLDAPLHFTSALRDQEVDALFRALAVNLARERSHE